MKNEKRFVKYDKELQIEAYWFQGILQKFPQHFHEYYVLGFVEKSGLRHMCSVSYTHLTLPTNSRV